MNKHLFYFLAFLICSAQSVIAQDTLSLEEAISTALKNNYDIRLVNNEIQIAKNNLNAGNAGMLPGLVGTFSQ
ncbi:TolC family protein [Pedobacter sp. NJ-S-72]